MSRFEADLVAQAAEKAGFERTATNELIVRRGNDVYPIQIVRVADREGRLHAEVSIGDAEPLVALVVQKVRLLTQEEVRQLRDGGGVIEPSLGAH